MSNNVRDNLSVETPLSYFNRVTSHYTADQNEIFNDEVEFGLVIKESPLKSHINIRGNAADKEFLSAVLNTTGVKLPTVAGTYYRVEGATIYWLGPNEWLFVSEDPKHALEKDFRRHYSGHCSVVNVSGGQTLVNLRGKSQALETVLKKSMVYDFLSWQRADAESGRCVQSTFARATALLSNQYDGSYDLIVRRSYADYIAQWLLDAGRDFGCRVETA